MPWLLRMTLLVAVIKAGVDLYLGWRITRSLNFFNPKSRPWWKWIPAGIFFLFYLFPLTGLIHYAIGFDVDVLSYPRMMVYLFWLGFAFSFQVLVWIVILDILKITANKGIGIYSRLINRWYGVLVIGFSIVILLFTGIKMYRDTTSIETNKVEYTVKDLPDELEGFRIVHISDIQADRYTPEKKIERYIELINKQRPGIVVFTGDLISYGTRYIDMAAHQLSKIEASHGVYFVIGDHDYWAGVENVKEALREHNITILDGKNTIIKEGGTGIRLTGLTNVYSRNVPVTEIKQLTRDSTETPVKILASHQVSNLLVEHAAGNGYDMILAGHTHGGQVRVPVFFKKISASNFETEYIQGVYYEKDMLINVNSGLGFTLAPVRYNAPANITVIELKRDL